MSDSRPVRLTSRIRHAHIRRIPNAYVDPFDRICHGLGENAVCTFTATTGSEKLTSHFIRGIRNWALIVLIGDGRNEHNEHNEHLHPSLLIRQMLNRL